MTEKIPGWLERVLLPRLSEMAGEIKAVNVRIEALDEKPSTKIDEVDKRLAVKIGPLDRLNLVRICSQFSGQTSELERPASAISALRLVMSRRNPMWRIFTTSSCNSYGCFSKPQKEIGLSSARGSKPYLDPAKFFICTETLPYLLSSSGVSLRLRFRGFS